MKVTSLILALAIAGAAVANDQPITKPIRYTWIATSCETWNCAVAALVMADGDKHVLVLPTGVESHPWIVLKRVEEGSVFVPEDEPFACDVFDGVDGAASRFQATGSCHAPLMLSVPDGRAVMVSLKQCGGTGKRRAAR